MSCMLMVGVGVVGGGGHLQGRVLIIFEMFDATCHFGAEIEVVTFMYSN